MTSVDSWLAIVEDVIIQGCPEAITDAAGQWDVQYSRLRNVADRLRQGKAGQENAWNSPAGQAFSAHLEQIAQKASQLEQDLRPISVMLTDAATALETARSTIPVPTGLTSAAANLHSGFMTAGTFSPGTLQSHDTNNLHLLEEVSSGIFDAALQQALAATTTLDSAYDGHYRNTPNPMDYSQVTDAKKVSVDLAEAGAGSAPRRAGVSGLATAPAQVRRRLMQPRLVMPIAGMRAVLRRSRPAILRASVRRRPQVPKQPWDRVSTRMRWQPAWLVPAAAQPQACSGPLLAWGQVLADSRHQG